MQCKRFSVTFLEAIGILFDSPPDTLTRTTIQQAFSRKMKTVHPDLNPESTKNIGFEITRIKEARDYLEKSPNISPITSWSQHNRFRASQFPESQTRNHHKATQKSARSFNQSFSHQFPWMPQRPLRFGQYLYYRKAISWKQLIEGILAQRSIRVSFGEVAIDLGFLKQGDLLVIRRSIKPGMFFGEAAVNLGKLTKDQVTQVLSYQARGSKPLGRVFMERGVLTQDQLNTHLWDFKVHNFRFNMGSDSSAQGTEKQS
jgi:hypothetical protein